MIKTEHDKVLTLYCQDQKIITNGKLLRVELGFPYQIMSFRYVGESSKEYTRGDFYNVIDCGPYWHSNEIVVWVTDNGHPETTDVDYCTAFSFDTFLSDFEYDSKYLELMNKADNLEDHLLPYSKEMIQKIRDEKMQLVTVDEFVKLQKESLTAIRENDKLKEQLDTAKKALTESEEKYQKQMDRFLNSEMNESARSHCESQLKLLFPAHKAYEALAAIGGDDE